MRDIGAKSADQNLGELSRRRFLRRAGISASVGAAALASGAALVSFAGSGEAAARPDVAKKDIGETDGVDSRSRWGLFIDTDKCARDCDACVRGCNEEHGLRPGRSPETDAQWIRKVTLRHRGTGKVTSLPLLCQHCENPPCVDVCPTGASFRRADGIVLVDKHSCIGCRYCMMACPYKARSFIHEDLTDQRPHSPRGKGTVESCNLCVHRVDAENQGPACAEACTQAGHGAIVFGDLNDPNSEVAKRRANSASVQLRADLGLNTGVRYTPF